MSSFVVRADKMPGAHLQMVFMRKRNAAFDRLIDRRVRLICTNNKFTSSALWSMKSVPEEIGPSNSYVRYCRLRQLISTIVYLAGTFRGNTYSYYFI